MIALLVSGAVALFVSLFGTRFLMLFFGARGQGQPILGAEDHGPEHHRHKEGTPTMGGLAILAAATIGYLVSHLRRGVVFADQSLIIFGGVFVMAGLGFLDDFIKVRIRRNRGVFWKKKGWITLALAAVIATVLVTQTGIDTRVGYTRADLPGWELGRVGWIIWATLIIFATVNAVNVTDGLDGLAAGSGLFGFMAFTVIAFWGFRNPDLYGSIVNPLDLAVLAVAFAGACAGFLWWNAAPARIIMGDVGALGLGAALALLALSTNTHLMLPLICGINVMEIGSVAAQMGSYKAFNKRRIFRMSPVHHHFELIGWPETTVIIRLWIIAGICVAAALGLYYADFARNEGLV